MEFGIPMSVLTGSNELELIFNDFGQHPGSLAQVITPYEPGVGNGYLVQDVKGMDGAPIRNPMSTRPHKAGGIQHAFERDFRVFTVEGIIIAQTKAKFVELEDTLRGAAEYLMREQGRFFFRPSAQAIRFLEIKHYEAVENSDQPYGSAGPKGFTFTCVSERPYPMTYTQVVTNVPEGVPTVIPNDGTAETWPVVKVYGPSSGFTLARDDGYSVIWVGSLGGGSYIEIDMFKETMYNNGDEADRLGGFDLENADFFPIERDGNTLTITGAYATTLSNHAWA